MTNESSYNTCIAAGCNEDVSKWTPKECGFSFRLSCFLSSFGFTVQFLSQFFPGWWFHMLYFLFSPLPGEMIQIDKHIFQMG